MLSWFLKKINARQKGFTLIEMIVVIGIIAILVGIAVPQAVKQINRAKINADLANARNIAMAIQQYILDGKSLENEDKWKPVDGADFLSYLSGGVPKPKYSSDYKGFCYKYFNETVSVGVYKVDNSGNIQDVISLYPTPESPYNQ